MALHTPWTRRCGPLLPHPSPSKGQHYKMFLPSVLSFRVSAIIYFYERAQGGEYQMNPWVEQMIKMKMFLFPSPLAVWKESCSFRELRDVWKAPGFARLLNVIRGFKPWEYLMGRLCTCLHVCVQTCMNPCGQSVLKQGCGENTRTKYSMCTNTCTPPLCTVIALITSNTFYSH